MFQIRSHLVERPNNEMSLFHDYIPGNPEFPNYDLYEACGTCQGIVSINTIKAWGQVVE